MSALSDLDPCEPGTVTPLWVPVGYMDVPEAPGGVIAVPSAPSWIGWTDELQWPPRTPGTHAHDDVETEYAR